MKTKKLTQRQSEVLDLIKNYMKENSMPPTRAEIARVLGFRSVNAAEDHLKALAKKGAIKILPGLSRGIRLTENQGLPIITRAAPGQAILEEENIEMYLPFEPQSLPKEPTYLLRMRGNSMRDIGIIDGDLVAIFQQDEVHNGQVIAVRLDSEITIKRYYRENQIIRLVSENTDYPPIEINLDHQKIEIEGVAIGLIRQNIG